MEQQEGGNADLESIISRASEEGRGAKARSNPISARIGRLRNLFRPDEETMNNITETLLGGAAGLSAGAELGDAYSENPFLALIGGAAKGAGTALDLRRRRETFQSDITYKQAITQDILQQAKLRELDNVPLERIAPKIADKYNLTGRGITLGQFKIIGPIVNHAENLEEHLKMLEASIQARSATLDESERHHRATESNRRKSAIEVLLGASKIGSPIPGKSGPSGAGATQIFEPDSQAQKPSQYLNLATENNTGRLIGYNPLSRRYEYINGR